MAVTYKVQVFARAPVSGEVKTRLIPRLGADLAARVQQRLTERTVATAKAAQVGPVELWCSPAPIHPSFVALHTRGITLREQGDGDIGMRMQRALADALRSGEYPILIGSDCPSLCAQDLRDAAQALQAGADVAFVPAEDGGYVLIAARTCSPDLFDGIDWGSSRVMAQTRKQLRRLGYTWTELATRWDLDRPEDYDRLLRELPQFSVAPS
ncbi:MAG: TIGR04282 family arsenosugar biosynthesis glycosyltransferase [Burkholderiales bacterium]|jgi:rSAM/selenodomain-associated transferase 1